MFAAQIVYTSSIYTLYMETVACFSSQPGWLESCLVTEKLKDTLALDFFL